MNRGGSRLWWRDSKPYSDDVADLVSASIAGSLEHRRVHIDEHAAFAWMLERERYMERGTVQAVPPFVGRRFGWLGSEIPPSINIFRSVLDTLLSWLFADPPALDISTPHMSGGERRMNQRRSRALDGTMNSREARAKVRRVAQDGLLKGFSAMWPRLRCGKVYYQRLHYFQVLFDPYDARTGEPTHMHVVELVDRSGLLAWYRRLDGIPNHKARIKMIEDMPRVEQLLGRADSTYSAVGSYVSPYETELTQTGTYNGSDQIRLLHSWRLATEPGADDGRYAITVHGDTQPLANSEPLSPGLPRSVTVLDRPFTRTTFPVCWWSPFPADEGVNGTGFGHLLEHWQEAIDRSFFKLQRALDLYGHIKYMVPRGSIAATSLPALLAQGITVVEVDGTAEPQIFDPQVLRSEDINWIVRCLEWSQAPYGVNQMLATGQSQLGANAPYIALVEEEDRQTERLANVWEQFQDFRCRLGTETFNLLADSVEVYPKLTASWRDKSGHRLYMPWKALLPHETWIVEPELTGSLGRTRKGRLAKILDAASRQILDPKLAKDALLNDPAIRHLARLETAGYRLVERQLEELIDPKGDHDLAVVDEDTPLDIAKTYVEAYIYLLKAEVGKMTSAEQDTLERLRSYKLAVTNRLAKEAAKQAPLPPGAPGGIGPQGEIQLPPSAMGVVPGAA